jgi:pimeloyl-ACP methyl ester carboxylesterase
MSPRRKALAIALALLVLAGGGAAAAFSLGRAGAGPSAAAVAQGRPGPVLLVPGYGGKAGGLAVLAARIRATGRQATVLRLPGTGTGSLVTDAAVLNAAVSRALDGGAPSVDVIGYSAGGVVALLWARSDDGAARARRVITLGAPFHGTSTAAGAQSFAPGACPLACQQLVPGSSLLTGLDPADPAGLPRWMSLWTTGDRTVIPPDSARLAGAINVPLQSLCPRLRIGHSQLPTDPTVTAIVLQAIGPGPITRPGPADCRG